MNPGDFLLLDSDFLLVLFLVVIRLYLLALLSGNVVYLASGNLGLFN
jgi:hypothetical protein